jgi:post-segregation antitoxin (ccd killing protein)
MTREDIIQMAREAGFNWPETSTTTIEERLERFAALAVAAEREACAQVAEAWDADHPKTNYGLCIGNAIRARGSK